MWRLLHFIAIAALIGSAAYVYSVKYQTIYASEEIVKTRHLIAKERDAINLLRAEYAHLTLGLLGESATPSAGVTGATPALR